MLPVVLLAAAPSLPHSRVPRAARRCLTTTQCRTRNIMASSSAEPPVDAEALSGNGVDANSFGTNVTLGSSTALGLAGLAASGAGISTIATAGGVCLGGACAVGGAAAAPAAAGTLAGLHSLLAGGLLAGLIWNPFSGAQEMPPAVYALDSTMAAMVRQSTPIDAVVGSKKPTIVEFYRPACPRCNRLAPALAEVEERARAGGANWVMVNTDEPTSLPLIRKLGVSELPHFSYFERDGTFVGDDAGFVDPEDVSRTLDALLALRGGGYASRPPAEVAARLRATPATTLLVDVRQPAEYRLDGHIEGSLVCPAFSWEHGYHLPRGDAFVAELSDEVDGWLSEQAGDSGAPASPSDAEVVLLCADGRLSAGAAQVLEDTQSWAAGVSVVEGGLQAWAEAAEEDSSIPTPTIDEDDQGGLVGAWV